MSTQPQELPPIDVTVHNTIFGIVTTYGRLLAEREQLCSKLAIQNQALTSEVMQLRQKLKATIPNGASEA